MCNSFKINGYQEGINNCDRCGKTNLKGTYHITTEGGTEFNLGSSCVKKAYQMTQKEFTKKVNDDKMERRCLARGEKEASIAFKTQQEYFAALRKDRRNRLSLTKIEDLFGKDMSELKQALAKKYNLREGEF